MFVVDWTAVVSSVHYKHIERWYARVLTANVSMTVESNTSNSLYCTVLVGLLSSSNLMSTSEKYVEFKAFGIYVA